MGEKEERTKRGKRKGRRAARGKEVKLSLWDILKVDRKKFLSEPGMMWADAGRRTRELGDFRIKQNREQEPQSLFL